MGGEHKKGNEEQVKKSSLLSTATFICTLRIPVVFTLPAYIVLWANSGLRVNLAGICLLACALLHLLQCLKNPCVEGSV